MGQGLEAGHRSRCGSCPPCTRIGSDNNPLDLVEFPVVAIDADESVEVACDVRRLCGSYAYRSRVYINSSDPLVVRCPLFGHPSKGFLLSRFI